MPPEGDVSWRGRRAPEGPPGGSWRHGNILISVSRDDLNAEGGGGSAVAHNVHPDRPHPKFEISNYFWAWTHLATVKFSQSMMFDAQIISKLNDKEGEFRVEYISGYRVDDELYPKNKLTS